MPKDSKAKSTSKSKSNAADPGDFPAAWRVTDDELNALDALGKEGLWRVGADELKLTNLDKPLFERTRPGRWRARSPSASSSATSRGSRPTMLRHLDGRPLNLQRFPNGAGAPGFWQKDIPETAPKWLTRWHETGVDGRTDRDANDHLLADRAAALAWLGNQASFEIHAWTGRLPNPGDPPSRYIDIDPGEKTTWDETLVLARLYRTALGHLGVRGYPKTTGKRGIQVWIPIEPTYDFSETSALGRAGQSRAVGSTVPDLVSWEWAKEARKGRARLDYTQNASIKTLVAPYAVRPAPGAPVSAPITWDELDDPDLRPDRWTIRTIVERVAERRRPLRRRPDRRSRNCPRSDAQRGSVRRLQPREHREVADVLGRDVCRRPGSPPPPADSRRSRCRMSQGGYVDAAPRRHRPARP